VCLCRLSLFSVSSAVFPVRVDPQKSRENEVLKGLLSASPSHPNTQHPPFFLPPLPNQSYYSFQTRQDTSSQLYILRNLHFSRSNITTGVERRTPASHPPANHLGHSGLWLQLRRWHPSPRMSVSCVSIMRCFMKPRFWIPELPMGHRGSTRSIIRDGRTREYLLGDFCSVNCVFALGVCCGITLWCLFVFLSFCVLCFVFVYKSAAVVVNHYFLNWWFINVWTLCFSRSRISSLLSLQSVRHNLQNKGCATRNSTNTIYLSTAGTTGFLRIACASLLKRISNLPLSSTSR
jgi:hypothetical protein